MNDILQFLKDWKAWADADAPIINRWNFKRNRALCSNLTMWCHTQQMRVWERSHAGKEFEHLLLVTLGDADYPFGGIFKYDHECRNETVHRNPDRLAWVDKLIAELSA